MSHRSALFLSLVILLSVTASRVEALDQCVALPAGTAIITGTVKAGGNDVMSQVTALADFEGVGTRAFTGFYTGFGGPYVIEVPAPATYTVFAAPIVDYAPEFYDGVLTKAAATQIPVTPGQGVDNINFTVVEGATLSGNVTDAVSGEPVEGVPVQAWAFGEMFHVGSAETDVDGNYEITGLATLGYSVFFSPDPTAGDYLFEVYDNKPGFPGDVVNVTSSGVTGIDAALDIGGRIEGSITGPSNEPLEEVDVVALPDDVSLEYSAVTDVGGNYSILAAEGSYKVYVRAPADMLSEYYDNKPDRASAQSVAVTASETTTGINAKLESSGHITGRVTDAETNGGIPYIAVVAYDVAGEVVTVSYTDSDGNYVLASDLRTGTYRIGFESEPRFDGTVPYADVFYSGKSTLNAANAVNVTAAQTTTGIDQEMVRCDLVVTTTTIPAVTTTTVVAVTTTTVSIPTTTLPITTTTLSGGTTTTVPGATTTTVPNGTTTTVPVTTTTVTGSTTTLPETTTTTVPREDRCGDPAPPVGQTTAGDALFMLRTAVELATCEPCVCDVNGVNSITAADALLTLRKAVEQPVEFSCPACP